MASIMTMKELGQKLMIICADMPLFFQSDESIGRLVEHLIQEYHGEGPMISKSKSDNRSPDFFKSLGKKTKAFQEFLGKVDPISFDGVANIFLTFFAEGLKEERRQEAEKNLGQFNSKYPTGDPKKDVRCCSTGLPDSFPFMPILLSMLLSVGSTSQKPVTFNDCSFHYSPFYSGNLDVEEETEVTTDE